MSNPTIVAALLIAGVIHLLPLTGVLGARQLSALYGIDVSNPDLLVLMRHRAVLFGIVGALLVAAVAVPTLRTAAISAGLTSVVAFLWIAWSTPGTSAAIGRIVAADVVALAALAAAGLLSWLQRG